MHFIGGLTRPLDLTEIRARIALFLSNADSISCMRVNKAWFKDFAVTIWYTLDFDEEQAFSHPAPATIAKYGHLIRRVNNIAKEEHLSLLQQPAVNLLTELGFLVTNDSRARGLFFDIFRRNRSTLKVFDISARLIEPTTFEELSQNGSLFLSIDMPVSVSKLTLLALESVCLTRDNFSDILQCSPRLESVVIYNTALFSHSPMLNLFRHPGVKTLIAPLTQVWFPDDRHPESPSLLVHFPSLETWKDAAYIFPDPVAKMSDLRTELSRHCPDLTRVDFTSQDSDPKAITDLLVEVLFRIKYCRCSYTLLDRSLCFGILQHLETLTQVILVVPVDYACATKPDLNPDAKYAVSLILRVCRSLEEFTASGHKMDIAEAEEREWACEGLKILSMQFWGLETAAAVDDCLERLVVMRNRITQGGGDLNGIDSSETSVSHRVCKKLFPMKKLKTVWMGTKNYYLATH